MTGASDRPENVIHDLIIRWVDSDDEYAGSLLLKYLAEWVVIPKITPRGVLLAPGPRWESK